MSLRQRLKGRWGITITVGLLAFTAIASGLQPTKATRSLKQPDNTPVRPVVPTADRSQSDKVFLERADQLSLERGNDYQLLVGNVVLRKGPMWMYCDSAHFFDRTGSLQAFGNVRMEQGDTLFVYADFLDYNGPEQLAVLTADAGKEVRLINKDVMLVTDQFYYDLAIELGYYNTGGVLTDKRNRLEALYGEYSPATKDANFYTNVHLNSRSTSDTLDIYTDTLLYNTYTHIARLVCPSEIINSEGTIYTSDGVYNTATNVADLYERSIVETKTHRTLTGDTLMYDRRLGIGEAFGNMVLVAPDRKMTLKGDYGFYNELTDSIFVTGRALGMEYSGKDTLYVHGDTIRGFKVITPAIDSIPSDTTHYLIANPHVRFYRTDLQGLCDSLTFVQRDSILYMDIHPVVWSGKRQIFGGRILVHLNDSTADWADLPNFGFAAELIEEPFYNQLSGKQMKAFFEDQDLRHLDVSGNVQAIFLPQENDSTYNKIVNVESSFMAADFNRRELERMKMWPETSGTTTPLYLAKKSLYYLPRFKWWEKLRPTSPEDVFIWPEAIEELFAIPDSGRKTLSK